MARRFRTIREGEQYSSQVASLGVSVQRLDEVLYGITWGISRRPEGFEEIFGGLRIAKTDPFPDAPVLVVYFTVDDENHCTLRWIEESPSADEEDDL